jgi:CBS domain-containing protein
VNDFLHVVAKLMWDYDCGALPVVREDGRLVGMITDRDICMGAYLQGHALDEILVSTVMSRRPVSARADQPITDALSLMAEHQIRRVPVVDAEGKPIGLVSLNDLAIECTQSDTPMRHGLVQVAHTFAAICRPHRLQRKAA